ncbi:hypothetical protein DFH09DRAFT_1379133 [Mycena vulgaris]|nr:hypothetical protein DFH09DRAFT_1379133 [Mycena vulgaris]
MGKAECTGGRAAKGMRTVSCCLGVNVAGPRRGQCSARSTAACSTHMYRVYHCAAPSLPSISPSCSLPRRVSSEPRARLPFQFRRTPLPLHLPKVLRRTFVGAEKEALSSDSSADGDLNSGQELKWEQDT